MKDGEGRREGESEREVSERVEEKKGGQKDKERDGEKGVNERNQSINPCSRPNARTISLVETEQKKIFGGDGSLPHPIISLYVRHGDKWKEAQPKTLKDYILHSPFIHHLLLSLDFFSICFYLHVFFYFL